MVDGSKPDTYTIQLNANEKLGLMLRDLPDVQPVIRTFSEGSCAARSLPETIKGMILKTVNGIEVKTSKEVASILNQQSHETRDVTLSVSKPEFKNPAAVEFPDYAYYKKWFPCRLKFPKRNNHRRDRGNTCDVIWEDGTRSTKVAVQHTHSCYTPGTPIEVNWKGREWVPAFYGEYPGIVVWPDERISLQVDHSFIRLPEGHTSAP
eukprot:TRINITY_DN1835_c0_g1_i1.p1 TRINITY_DN1835_c0_g1~~TRINITY_DN1835_c0_g1_i1.p1  ORF type:complete len:207 (+),score=27.10 TRINITY_DN1835_c0_g1_i1:656-1276(+)